MTVFAVNTKIGKQLKRIAVPASLMRAVGPVSFNGKSTMKLQVPLVSIAAALLVGVIGAQNLNDGFSSWPPCAPTTAATNLPAFPVMTVGGLGAVIADCGVESQFNTSATLVPMQVLPDYWLITITIDAQPAFSIGNQTLVAKYARTWLEGPPIGLPIQIWRFLVNGDLVYTPGATGGPGNPIPLSALPPYSMPVHFVGHLDFVQKQGSGVWEIAYSLTHFCPIESHAAFSQRPIPEASQWPNRTYHFVGPSNFVFDAFPSPAGFIVGESSRRSTGIVSPGPYTVFNEASIQRGIVTTSSLDCVGGSATSSTPRYSHQFLGLASEYSATQNAPISSSPIGIPTIPTGLRGLGIGKFVAQPGAQYPGEEYVSVYLGVLDAPGVCPAPSSSPSLRAVTGVGTAGGFLTVLFGLELPYTAVSALDLHDMNVLTPAGFVPGFGSLFGSERVWSIAML
jgi:hypothetical protein